jgi:hypothetical protein
VTTVEGGPGLVLDNLLDVLRNNVNQGVDCWRVLSVQCLPLVLSELVLVDEHVGYLVLDVLEGSEGDLLLHVGLLNPCSLSNHLHVGLLRHGVVVLDVLGGGEGGVQRSAIHVKLLSLVPSLHHYRDLLRLCVECELHGNLLRLVGLVLDDDEGAGVECRRRRRSASARRAPQTCPWQPTRQSCSWQS